MPRVDAIPGSDLPKLRVQEVRSQGITLEFKARSPYSTEYGMSPVFLTIEEAEEVQDELGTQIARAKQVRAVLS